MGRAELWLMSAVKAPGKMPLQAISVDMADQRYAEASRKLQILRSHWRTFEQSDGFAGPGIGHVVTELEDVPGEKVDIRSDD